MRKTAEQMMTAESKRVFEDIKKLALLTIKHPDPAIRKEAAAGANKLLKILAALGITGLGAGGGIMAAERGTDSIPEPSYPGINNGVAAGLPAGVPEVTGVEDLSDYESPDFDAILRGEGLGDYADSMIRGQQGGATPKAPVQPSPRNAGAAQIPSITPDDFEIGDQGVGSGSTAAYDTNFANVEKILNELSLIDDRMGNNTLGQEEIDALSMQREALMQQLENQGFSDLPDNYQY